jgi:outer membrane protein assembly factor BamB
MLLVIPVAAATVAGGLAAWWTTRAGESDESAGDRIPIHADERWSVILDASSVAAVTSTGNTIVAATGPAPTLLALDSRTGAERWRVPGRDDSLMALEVVDGVVVADYLAAGGDQSLVGFDLGDGHRLWTATVGRGRGSVVTDELVVSRFDRGEVRASVDLLDATTGTRITSIEADEISMSSTSIYRRQGDVIEWYDPDTFARRGQIDLAALGLERLEAAVAPTDVGLVVATSHGAVLVDASGSVLSSVPLSTERDGPPTLDELDGSGRFVVLQDATDTTMLTIVDGRLEALWTRSARAVDWLIDDSHQLLALLPWGDQPGAYDLGAPWMEVVDAATGRPIWSGRLTRSVNGAFSVLGRNGFVAAGPPPQGATSWVAGYAFDGTELWRRAVTAGGAPLTLIPGALVAVGSTASGAATLTLLA